jgi:hypothetical protein
VICLVHRVAEEVVLCEPPKVAVCSCSHTATLLLVKELTQHGVAYTVRSEVCGGLRFWTVSYPEPG